MTYAQRFKAALLGQFDHDWLHFKPGWDRPRRCAWQAKGNVPSALMLHHTAACNGEHEGDNDSIIDYIQNHYEVPAANLTLDRPGDITIHSAYPIWHAGLGTFKGKAPWSALGIAADTANDHLMGVEIMSKGLRKDFTIAQQTNLVFLLRAVRDASGWSNIGLLRRPRHVDWAGPRKVDILYSNAEVGAMILKYGFASK